MNLKHRIRKLESALGAGNGGFCRCGTSYFDLNFVAKQKRKINDICDKCGKDVKPQTHAEFIEANKHLPIIVIKPTVQNEH